MKIRFPLRSRLLLIASAIAVPFLHWIAPSWLSLNGLGPSWSILWLLPWSLLEGPISGALAGFSLGLSLDSMSLGDATHAPVLAILGIFWGYLGRRYLFFQRSFGLGFLGWIGSLSLGFSLWLQFSMTGIFNTFSLFNLWSLYVILGQSILTGMLAPLICSFLLIFFKNSQFFPSNKFPR